MRICRDEKSWVRQGMVDEQRAKTDQLNDISIVGQASAGSVFSSYNHDVRLNRITNKNGND